jgi:hypothetical protein
MGNYRFERDLDDGAGQGAGASLEDDVEHALAQIHWVDHFTIHAESSNDSVVSVDVIFDEDWPDLRAGDRTLVSTVFRRLGLRTIARASSAGMQATTTDPLGVDAAPGDDSEEFDLFQFED